MDFTNHRVFGCIRCVVEALSVSLPCMPLRIALICFHIISTCGFCRVNSQRKLANAAYKANQHNTPIADPDPKI